VIKLKCPKCKAKMFEDDVDVSDDILNILTWRCPDCNHEIGRI